MRLFVLLLAMTGVSDVLAATEPDGILTARVVIEEGKAEILEIRSGLPDSVKQQLRPDLERRALQAAQREGRLEEAEYTVGISWKVKSVDGKDRLSFDFANTEPRGLDVAPAEPPPSMYSVMEPVTVTYAYSVAVDGEVNLESCEPSAAKHGDACKQLNIALKRSEYLPKFVNGIATKSRVNDVITFRPN